MPHEREIADGTQPQPGRVDGAPVIAIPVVGPLRDLKPKAGDTVEIRIKGHVKEVTGEQISLAVTEAGLVGSSRLDDRERVRPTDQTPAGPPEAEALVQALGEGAGQAGEELESAVTDGMMRRPARPVAQEV